MQTPPEVVPLELEELEPPVLVLVVAPVVETPDVPPLVEAAPVVVPVVEDAELPVAAAVVPASGAVQTLATQVGALGGQSASPAHLYR